METLQLEPGVGDLYVLVSISVRRDSLCTIRASTPTSVQCQAGPHARPAHLKKSLKSIIGRSELSALNQPLGLFTAKPTRDVDLERSTYVKCMCFVPKLPFFQI